MPASEQRCGCGRSRDPWVQPPKGGGGGGGRGGGVVAGVVGTTIQCDGWEAAEAASVDALNVWLLVCVHHEHVGGSGWMG